MCLVPFKHSSYVVAVADARRHPESGCAALTGLPQAAGFEVRNPLIFLDRTAKGRHHVVSAGQRAECRGQRQARWPDERSRREFPADPDTTGCQTAT